MAKRTLLNMTQGILSAMDSDDVNSISDTNEAVQVARVIEDVYNDIIDEHDLATTMELFSLEASGTATKPTHMRLPDNISKIAWIKYNVRLDDADAPSYQRIEWLAPEQFVEMVTTADSTDTATYVVVPHTANINFAIDKTRSPHYWTSFDDEYIIFDAYNSALDSTLITSKTLCYGNTRPTFTSASDTFIPDLPENLFGLLYNESMSRCMNLFKQTMPKKVEQTAVRMRTRAQRNKWRQTVLHEGVDYGRR